MDILKWHNKYSTDIRLVYNSDDTKNNYKRLAGHSNVKTTLLYTHISDNLISKIKSPLSNINLNTYIK
jgi:hypothetical protein